MRFPIKKIILGLLFSLCFVAVLAAIEAAPAPTGGIRVAMATDTSLEDEIQRLEALIRSLEAENRRLDAENWALRDTIANPPTPPLRRPFIQVTDPLLVEVEAGSQRVIAFSFNNLSGDAASAIITTVDFAGAQGITGAFTDGGNHIQNMAARAQRTVNYRININETVREGFYTITFRHEYRNANNTMNESTSQITIRVINPGGGVTVRDIASSPGRVAPGQDFNLTAVIQNDSPLNIRDVSMTIAGGMASDGVFLRDSTNVVSIPNMRAGQRENVSLGFAASHRARSAAYPLRLELSYTDTRGERQTREYTFFVIVSGDATQEDPSEVVITNISHPSGAMRVGQEFEMVVTLRNTGLSTAQNIRVDAATDAERAIVPRSTSRMLINQLAPDEEQQLIFRFAPTALAASRSYDIGFTVTYETGIEDPDGIKETVTFTQFQGVTVFVPEDDDSDDEPGRISTPRIIVSDYRSDPLIVQAGQEFELEVSFLNTSSNRTVRNIRVTLTVDEEVTTGTERRGSVFTPVGRSSTFFIDSIEPRGEVVENIRFFTLPDAPPRNYVINVNFEYEDTDNNPFEARESIGINVKQVTRLSTSEIFIPEFAGAFQPIFLSFEIYNTGRVTLSNMMIRVEGNFMISQSSVFFGSVSPGMMDFYDNTVTPMESGTQELTLIISYEDDTGELIEERRVFYIEVFEMDFGGDRDPWPPHGDDMVWDDRLGMFVPAPQGLSTWVIIAIAAGVLIAAGVVVLVIVRVKKTWPIMSVRYTVTA
jgi:hypothetical protein